MEETGSLSQGGEGRGSQRKTELKGLRNQYLQEQAGQGLPIEDLSTAFSLSEGHLKNNVLSIGSYRKREKGEAPLNKLQINGIKLEFAFLMGQKGFTIEQCNYMLNLTSDSALERQEKQQELENKLAKCYGTLYMDLFSVTLVKLIHTTYSLVGGIIIFSIIATARVPGGWGWKTPKVF